MFTEALFSTPEIWKQPVSNKRQMNKKMIWCIYTKEYYSATIKK